MALATDELEAIRQLEARYCRFLNTKDVDSWRDVFTTDVVVLLDMAVSAGGADPQTATGIWAMEDLLIFADGSELHGAGHYHETYAKRDGCWRIKSLHLTRTILRVRGG